MISLGICRNPIYETGASVAISPFYILNLSALLRATAICRYLQKQGGSSTSLLWKLASFCLLLSVEDDSSKCNAKKYFLNYNKHKRIISFPNKCAFPSILNWKGLKMELSKLLHVFKYMWERDVLMCHDKLLPKGLKVNQQCKYPLGLGQNPSLYCAGTVMDWLLKSFCWEWSLEEYDKAFD